MNQKDLRLWMKVKPHNKTPDGRVKGLENSVIWKIAQERNQDFLYVATIPSNYEYPECLLVSDFRNKNNGDYFLCSDFERYVKLK